MSRVMSVQLTVATPVFLIAAVPVFAACLFCARTLFAQRQQIVWSEQEKPIVQQLHGLRQVPDEKRGQVTKDLALAIRKLPASSHKLMLANGLANLSTEGDFGHDTLEEVATTLAAALGEQPPPANGTQPADPYVELATLVRYEHVHASSNSPQFAAAMSKLEDDDRSREHADFTLNDLEGKSWSLQALHGKVVLVNFWATWCPPCRKEMPDLDKLYQEFKEQGLLILAISGEDMSKVQPFIAEHHYTYPILLDPGSKVHQMFRVEGIPKSFVYARNGKLAAEAIDMRTRKQFLAMLAQAGIK
ncbi:Alkyl hydroperoxide reductase/ Thiol specific antioxidant/ Mal allergen [Acidobacteriia bacterium SbA2]|nr:Alkyl hydroperoxide reductase/ Thiol specific antioxidant/ Mal allergen [Acidobacteriia bacterium SbA2]